MRYVTDFADLAVLLPLWPCIGAGFALAGWRRGALAWTACIGAALGLILLLKLIFLGCGAHGALSPSGHTAAGTAIYGGATALWLRRRVGIWAACLLGGGGVAVLIGATRLALGVHVPLEVAIGGAVGLGGVVVLVRAAGPPPNWVRARRIVPAGLLLMLLLHGVRLRAEDQIRALAGWLPPKMCAQVGI